MPVDGTVTGREGGASAAIRLSVIRKTVIPASVLVVGALSGFLPIILVQLGAVAVLFLQAHEEIRAGDKWFLTSPLYLLGAIVVVFFSLFLGVFETQFPGRPFHGIESFYGSDADRAFVCFGLICLATHGLLAAWHADGRMPHARKTNSAGGRIALFGSVAMILTAINVANFISWKTGGPHITAIRSTVPPALAFCGIYLIYLTKDSWRKSLPLVLLILVVSIAGQFFILEGKKPVFMVVAGVLFWLRLRDVSVRKLVISGVMLCVLAAALIQLVQVARVPHFSVISSDVGNPLEMLEKVFRAKAVLRQAETRFCFQNVIDRHGDQPFEAHKQMFWLQGLVPRLLWPDKPSLSLGQHYAQSYCMEKKGSTHTASISLLGQPVVQGGWLGLWLHGGILVLCLAGLTRIGRHPHGLRTVWVAALLPWLIDFDQDLAMFVANAVKFSMVMAPLVVVAVWLEARSGRIEGTG